MDVPWPLIVLILCMAITLLTQSAITLWAYNKNKQGKDLNFYWSVLVLIVSIIVTVVSGFGLVMAFRESGGGGGGGGGYSGPAQAAGQKAALEAQLELIKAQEAANAAARAVPR